MKRMQFQNKLTSSTNVISCRIRLLVGTLIKSATLTIFSVSILLLPNAFAENYAQWGLPDGVKARLGKGYVGSLQFSADGNRLMVENTVGIWVYDAHSGVELDLITGNLSDSLVLSPDGSTAAGWGADDKLCLWQVADSEKKVTLKGDISKVYRVAFSLDGRTVAGALETGNGAPSAYSRSIELLTAAAVEQWLIQAQQVNHKAPVFQRGIAVLQSLLAVLTPKETMLLPNYPNPFNPETWLSYQLASAADVTIRIYAASGDLVRTLALGYQSSGPYQSRSQAAYWDGKNELGEPVASGVYFYTLTAGNFTATRKMLIQK